MNKTTNLKNHHGKTIASIDDTCANMWKINFTDGTHMEVMAEISGHPLAIPFLMCNGD